MFTLGVSDHVMIAHSFADPFFGPAQKLHGATYSIDLEVRSAGLGAHHVVMDIGALRSILREALATLDYGNLDEHPAFPNRTSTTERVAEHVAKLCAEKIAAVKGSGAPPAGSSLVVTVRESPVAWVRFERPL